LTKRCSDPTSPSRRPLKTFFSFWPLLLSGMVALLATAAFLQYRWTNEASAASEMRIGVELESLMMKWHADLYGEFSAICTAMQVGADSGARDTWNDYLERYVEWNSVLPRESLPSVYRNPELVEDVYIWDTNLGASPQLFRLNAEKEKIEAAEAPGRLKTLLNRLRANSSSLSTSLRVWQLPGAAGQSNAFHLSRPNPPEISMGWQFDESIPAIVHPIFQRDGRSLNRQSPVDWMVIVLDANALQQRILPGLAGRYFGGLEGLEYKVAVVAKGARPRTIYSSDPGFGNAAVEAADASLNIFGPSSERGQDSLSDMAPSHSLQSTEWHSFYGPVWFPVIRYEDGPNPWVLVVQHRADPLQEVIIRVRHQNLTMSALLLLLLALNMTLLTMAGIRAQKFTKMQMDFVASVSHELRTPLTAIFAAAENIKDGVIHDKSSLEDYGSMLMSQSRQLMDHVDRILVFASMRSGKDRYNMRPLHVSEVLERVRKNLAILIIEHGILIEEFVEPDLPCVIGDFLAVCGCLENLITNAIKYGGTDRRIRIRAQRESKESGEQELAISIEDHGIGIHRSDLKRIFEPFYRAADVTRAQIPGTGLGLSVSKHLAEAMGGRLSVESEFGVGSVFTLYLPVTQLDEGDVKVVSSPRQEVTEHE
jgi:two-component system, OmpR family, sensor histidine kinase SenX3